MLISKSRWQRRLLSDSTPEAYDVRRRCPGTVCRKYFYLLRHWSEMFYWNKMSNDQSVRWISSVWYWYRVDTEKCTWFEFLWVIFCEMQLGMHWASRYDRAVRDHMTKWFFKVGQFSVPQRICWKVFICDDRYVHPFSAFVLLRHAFLPSS